MRRTPTYPNASTITPTIRTGECRETEPRHCRTDMLLGEVVRELVHLLPNATTNVRSYNSSSGE
jgi:hypothetical protein